MGKRSSRSRSRNSNSDLHEFKDFHIPKIFQVFFLLMGITIGATVTAMIKNAITKSDAPEMEGLDMTGGGIPDEAPKSIIRAERQRAQASHTAVAPPKVPVAPRPPQRKIPLAVTQKAPERAPSPMPTPRLAPKVREQVQFENLMTPAEKSLPPQMAIVVPEPKAAPKKVVLTGLLYDREGFQNCAEDCSLTLRSSSGQSLRVKLKKSQFEKSLDRANSRIDIEGYASEDRVVTIEGVRAYPKRETQAPEALSMQLPPVKEVEAMRTVPEEFVNVVDIPESEPVQKSKSTRSQAQSLKSRLEASSGGSAKPAPVVEGGGSFQDRLRRSTR